MWLNKILLLVKFYFETYMWYDYYNDKYDLDIYGAPFNSNKYKLYIEIDKVNGYKLKIDLNTFYI
jgi:hypothetical protein